MSIDDVIGTTLVHHNHMTRSARAIKEGRMRSEFEAKLQMPVRVITSVNSLMACHVESDAALHVL